MIYYVYVLQIHRNLLPSAYSVRYPFPFQSVTLKFKFGNNCFLQFYKQPQQLNSHFRGTITKNTTTIVSVVLF